METYFTIGQVPADAVVGCMLMKIVPKHLNEIKRYQTLDYFAFREKLVGVFEEPDMATAHLTGLTIFSQTRKESISEYMLRARSLVLEPHLNLDNIPRERILVIIFRMGLYDRQLASSLAIAKI